MRLVSSLTKVLLSLIFLASSSSLFAEKKLPDAEFQDFLKQSKEAPGNYAKDQKLIRKLSIPQLQEAVSSFGLGSYGFLHPMRIKGEKFPEFIGRKFEELSVMSVWQGKLKPIPFQFDEFDKKNGYIYVPGINKSPINGTHLVLDESDLLIFMYRDAGTRKYDPTTMAIEEGKVLKEIKISDSRGNTRYAYLVENNSERSDADYITFDMNKSEVVSSFYRIKYSPKNFLDFKDVRPFVGKAADQRVIDNVYFELSANLSRFLRVGLNSAKNVRLEVLGVKDGPVRSTAFTKIIIVFGGGKIPVFSMNSEISFYEQGLSLPNRTEVGKGAMFVKIFKDPEIIVYNDMNGIDGGRVSAQAFIDENGERIFGRVDGRMDENEIKALGSGLPGDWSWIETGLGWDMFMVFEIPMEHLDGMSMSVYYEDDKDAVTDFETFPGAGPKIGMVMHGLPKDMKAIEELNMEYSFWFPDTVWPKGPEAFFNEYKSPPTAEVMDLK